MKGSSSSGDFYRPMRSLRRFDGVYSRPFEGDSRDGPLTRSVPVLAVNGYIVYNELQRAGLRQESFENDLNVGIKLE